MDRQRWQSLQPGRQSRPRRPHGITQINIDMVSGSSMYAGMWVDPSVLRRLRPGQVLDQDKLAGTTVAVGQISGSAVPIVETGQLHSIIYSYDMNSGICVAVVSTNEMLHTRIEQSLLR
jgi:hypothetical protein